MSKVSSGSLRLSGKGQGREKGGKESRVREGKEESRKGRKEVVPFIFPDSGCAPRHARFPVS